MWFVVPWLLEKQTLSYMNMKLTVDPTFPWKKHSLHVHIEQVKTISNGTAKSSSLPGLNIPASDWIAVSGNHIHQTIRYGKSVHQRMSILT
jgi:hypothetical protein